MRFLFTLRTGTLVWLVIFLTGCIGGKSSPTPRFYLLSPIQLSPTQLIPTQADKAIIPNDTADFPLTIGFTAVEVSEYLARPQIVTRTGASELMLAEFDRWAEPLNGHLFHVITENLSNLLVDHPIRILSKRKSKKADYELEIRIIRMDGERGDALTLIARWSLIKAEGGEVTRMKQTRITEPVLGADYHALVAAHSLAVNKLSREIAEEIRSMVRP